ncbi:MAG TPA: hypothetical protein DCK76_12015 [Desulfotomaculum sp.]|nr:MAG: Phage-related protein [Desulfotomaculum sp. 46_80]HAG12063.1 hypothetical protein [Desulfotomaculum sp.]HBY04203.1 hypothetical protein [Desulfotomaculum sp.]
MPNVVENSPIELRQIAQWVCYKTKPKDNGKTDKIPYNPKTGRMASTINSKTWGTFDQALTTSKNGGGYAGIGFVVTPDIRIIGIDLDGCRNKETGVIELWAQDIINQLSSYTEVSPSGTGIRIFTRGTINLPGRRKGKIECYNSGRFLTVTGNHVEGTPIGVMDRYAEVDAFHREFIAQPEQETSHPDPSRGSVDLDDADLINKACLSKNGELFLKLFSGDWTGYPSQSEADLALCNLLAFWTGCQADQMESLFRQSSLMREKVDKHPSYLKNTIQRAINGCTEVYTAGRTSPEKDFGGPLDWNAIIGSAQESEQELQADAGIELDDQDLINRACRAKATGEQFEKLYSGDYSDYEEQEEADRKFLDLLAFWSDKNAGQMERIFRQSGLWRENIEDLPGLIQTAIKHCHRTHKVYNKSELQKRLQTFRPHKNERYPATDIGNGNLFADCFKGIARYEPTRKKWFAFNGKVWKPDSGNLQAMQLCKTLANELMIYALSIPDDGERQLYMEFAGKWQSRHYRETILKDATSVYPVSIEEFDVNPWIFNCMNGTLNLETGEFYTHRPGDMLTKLSGVNYKPGVRCLRWEQFIGEVMEGDRDKAVFFQKSLGYTLTGDTRHECFFILYGPLSRNGKSTAMETYLRLVGDYGKTASPETIAQKQHADSRGPSEDIASLAGARFVNLSEPDKKLVLSAAQVKTMTGRDKIRSRFLHENSFEFYPQFKLFINSNHLPVIADDTIFKSGRVKIITFEHHFDENEQDKGLKNELTSSENLSGILNWCISGLHLIKETGFDMPESVISATAEYRRHSDKIGRFIDDEMEAVPLAETKTSDAYTRYKTWCSINGYYPENAMNFKALLSGVATIIRKRPQEGGGATPLVLGYRLRHDFTGF